MGDITAAFANAWRDFNTDGVPSSQAYWPDKAPIRAIGVLIDDAVEAAAEGRTQVATWTELAALPGARGGQPGRVTGGDTGTHTDPVVGGTVNNAGEYSWSVSPAGWRRIGNLGGNDAVIGTYEVVDNPAIAAGALTLDLGLSRVFKVTNNGNVTALAIANMWAGYSTSFTLVLTGDGTQRLWTWPASVVWAFNTPPPLTSANGKRDLFNFFTFDGGTTWFASVLMQNF